MRVLELGPMTGAELAELRRGLGMTQAEFAERLDLSASAVVKTERSAQVRRTTAYAARFVAIFEDIRRERES